MKIVRQIFADLPTSLLTFFLITISFGQLQRIQLSNNIAFYGHDLLILLFIIWWLINNHLKIKIKNWQSYKLELLMIVVVLFGMLIGLFENRVGPKSFLYLFRIISYSFFVWSLNKTKFKYDKKIGFMLVGLAIAIWGLLQYFLMPDTRFLNIFGWDNHYYRLISTTLDPAFTGMILAIAFGWWQIFIIQIILIIAIVATFSRASYLALAIILTWKWLKDKNWKWILLGGIAILTLLILPKPGGEGVNLNRTSTIEARGVNSKEALISLNGTQWLWGRGLFNSDAEKESYTNNHAQLPDSFPIMLINAVGIIGVVVFIFLLKKWLPLLWQENQLWTILLLATFIHGLFNNTLLQPFVFLMLWGTKNINKKVSSGN